MKSKFITAILAAALITGVSAMSASAWNHGPMMNNGYGMMNGSGDIDAGSQNFLNETKEIRITIAADQAELNALMAGQNPDSTSVRELSTNIATNQLALEEKSRAYGYGNGRMYGNHMRGSGMMNNGYYGGCNW